MTGVQGPFQGTKKPIFVRKMARKITHLRRNPTTLLLALQPLFVPIQCLLFFPRQLTRNGKPASALALVAVAVAAAWHPWVSSAHNWETHPALLGRPMPDRHRCGGVRAASVVGMRRHCQCAWGLAAAGRDGGSRGGSGCAKALSGRRRCNARTTELSGRRRR